MSSTVDCERAVARGRRSSNATTITDILDAAKHEFASRGFDGATVDSICRRARVSKQLLYYYFGSKSDLYTIILNEAAEGTSTLLRKAEYDALVPKAALIQFIGNMFSEYVSRPQIVQMTLDEAQHNFAHVGKASPLAMVLRSLINDVLGTIVERGRTEGVFRADLDSDQLFWVIFSLVTTWFAHSPLVALVSSTGSQPELDSAAWRASSIDFVLAAVSNPARKLL